MNKKKTISFITSALAVTQSVVFPAYAVSVETEMPEETTLISETISETETSEETTAVTSDTPQNTESSAVTESSVYTETSVSEESMALPETGLAFASDETAKDTVAYDETVEKSMSLEEAFDAIADDILDSDEKKIISSKTVKTAPVVVTGTKTISYANPDNPDEILTADININKTVAEFTWDINEYDDGTSDISVKYNIYRKTLDENIFANYPAVDAFTVYNLLKEQGFDKISAPSARIMFDTGVYNSSISLDEDENASFHNEIIDKKTVAFSDGNITIYLNVDVLYEQGYENDMNYITGFDFSFNSETPELFRYLTDRIYNSEISGDVRDTYSQTVFTVKLKPKNENSYDKHIIVIEDGEIKKPYIITLNAAADNTSIEELQAQLSELTLKYTELTEELEKYKSGELKFEEYEKLEKERDELKKELDELKKELEETKTELDKIKSNTSTSGSGSASSGSSSSGGSFVSSGSSSNKTSNGSGSSSSGSGSSSGTSSGSSSSGGSNIKSTANSETVNKTTGSSETGKTDATPKTGDRGVVIPVVIGAFATGLAGFTFFKRKKNKKND